MCAHRRGWQENLAHYCREKERLVDRDERLKELDDKYEDYAVYDNAGEKIGKVDDVFIDETDREEYIGVKMGLFGLSGKTLHHHPDGDSACGRTGAQDRGCGIQGSSQE